jgi:hypothetical protein
MNQGVSLDNSALKRAEPKKCRTGVAKVVKIKLMKNKFDQSSIPLPNVK